jgi:3-methylfumaryl-CoA hydratase
MIDAQPFANWIGRSKTCDELLAPAPAMAAAAMLDDTESQFDDGSTLPLLWHWFYFTTKTPASRIGRDGHPVRGGFLPPIDLSRRMFAGARLRFLRPLRIGRAATREGRIRRISQKAGRTGVLAFVTVDYTIRQEGRVCIEEEQDIVYHEPRGRTSTPRPAPWPPLPADAWSRTIDPDTTLLFRFSALTYNAHRIHYDRPYATDVEGYPGLVVQGPLTALLLIDLLRQRVARPVASFAFRGLAPLFDLAPFRIVAIAQGNAVELEAHGPDGKVAVAATAGLG